MPQLNEVTALKAKVDRLRRDADRAAGALEQAMARLKTEFKCDSLEAAQKLLKKLRRDESEAREAFEKKLAAFQKEWADELAEPE